MGNPDISGLPVYWYKDGTWPTSSITSSQNAYDTALTNLNTASADYLAKKDALNSVMASGTKTQISNAQIFFNIASTTLANALAAMQTAYANLTTTAQAAKTDIDNKVDQNLSDFAQNLMNVMNQQLTLPATVSNTLDLQFNNANDDRIAARTTFTAALSAFYSSQSSLNVLLNTFQQDNDTLLSLQAQYAKDSAPPAASAATLAADLAAINAQSSVVNTDSINIQNATSTRDARLSSLKSALLAYQTALNTQVGILSQAGQIASVTVTDFLADIQSILDNAQLAAQNAIAAAANADALLRNQLYAAFPSLDPSISQTTSASQDQYVSKLSSITGSTLNAPVDLSSNVNAPLLPAAGKMSMSQLMQFITLVEVLLDQLIREIRRTDSRVNELRLTLFEAAGRSDADKISAQQAFANKLMAADIAYNNKVALNNAEAMNNAAIQIQYYKDHPNAVNNAIAQLNSEIDDQNSRGHQVIAALNASLQMAADDNKVQLWADQGQLDDYINKLQTLTSDLASNDPLKAQLQAVTTSAGNLNGSLKNVSNILNERPVDDAAVDALQAQIATDLSALNTAISGLSSPTKDITSTLSGLTGYVAIITNDQDQLQLILKSAETQAATMLNTQVSSEAASLVAANNEFTRVINNLDPSDPSINLLTYYNNTLPPVAAALTQISADLNVNPVNWTTLNADYIVLQQALNNLSLARNSISLNMSGSSPITLSGPASDALANSDSIMNNVTTTTQSITSFLTPTTSYNNIRPIAVLPPPIQLQHVQTIDTNKLTIPTSIPTSGAFTGATSPNSASPSSVSTYLASSTNPLPLPPAPADVTALNNTITYLNKVLTPVIGRLHAGGNTNAVLLDPVYIRDYIPIRDPSNFIDYSVLAGMDNLISLIIQNDQSLTDTNNNPPTTALFTFRDTATSPNVTSGESAATGVGAGTGLGGANLGSGAGPVSLSLTAVLGSTDFQNYVRGIFEKSGLVAGLTAISNLATAVKAKTEFGVVTPGTPTTTDTVTTGLTTDQKTALASGVQELLSATQNVPQLKNDLLGILKATGESQKLSDEEIQQLLSLLLFLLQLVALLVASAAVAAGGGNTNIDNIVQKGFEKPTDNTLQSVATSLTNLGVTGLTPEITPSNPQFISNFIDVLNTNLTPAEQLGFVAQVTQVFTDRGITLNPSLPLGQAVQEVLLKTPSDVAGDIRQQLNKIALAQAEQLRSDILHDSSRRPSITTLIKQLNPEGFNQLPKDQTSSVSGLLNNTGPNIPGITPEDRNSLVLSVLKGVITPEQAKNIVEEFLKEGVLQTNPAVGSLLTTALKPTTNLPETPSTTPVTAIKPGTPGELPDLVNILATAFKALSKQTNDENFLQDTVTRFADSVRDQSDFFQKSLSLILDPANTYVKNFSIVTRQTSGHDNMGSVSQIPIAG